MAPLLVATLTTGLAACAPVPGGTSGAASSASGISVERECSCEAPVVEVSPESAAPGEEVTVTIGAAWTGDCCDGEYLEATGLRLSTEDGSSFELGAVELEKGEGSVTVTTPAEAPAGLASIVAAGLEEYPVELEIAP